MTKLTDILKEAGIQTGKVYTDKDRPPFKVNEFKSFSNRFRNSDTIRIKDQREYKRIMKYLDKKGYPYYDIGHGKGAWHIQFDNTREAGRIRAELEKKRFKIINPNNESMNEKKKDDLIYVPGLARYDYKGLKRNVENKIKDLTRRNKKGDHSGLGKNQFSVLAAMWKALSDYEENQ